MKTIFLAIIIYTVLQSADHQAWIDQKVQNEQMLIQGKFMNHRSEADTFRYELATIRQGEAGQSQSKQAGRFIAPAHQEIVLAQTSVSIQTNDTYMIRLKIFQEDSVYLSDQIVH